MKTAHVIGCLILAAIIIIPLMISWAGSNKGRVMRTVRRAFGVPAGIIAINGISGGRHENARLSLFADDAITTRYYLVKRGSDSNHFAVCAAASDEPLGVCFDQPSDAEYSAGVQLLGGCSGTVPVVAAETIAADDWLYSNGDGRVQDEPTVAGTFWMVGKAKDGASANQPLEMEPCTPIRVVVLAALTCADGIAGAAADLTALKTETEKLGDDFRRLAAACDGKTIIKFLAA